MPSSSDKINSSCTEELSWTDEESGSDHSLAEKEVMLYGLLHHEQQESTVPESTIDIKTSSRTKANRLNQVKYVTEQFNSMASRKTFVSSHFGKNNLPLPSIFPNKYQVKAAKRVERNRKRRMAARLKTKRKAPASVQSLLKEVYRLSAETPVENVITLYNTTSQGPSMAATPLSVNDNFNASNDCSLNNRNSNCIQSNAAVQPPSASESSGATLQPQVSINGLPRHFSEEDSPEIVVPSKYQMQLNLQKRSDTSLDVDIITLDSDDESIDSVIEVKPPTPPPPLVISIDSSDESSKIPLEKNKIIESVSKSKVVPTPVCIDQITTTTNNSNTNMTEETKLNPVTDEDSMPPVTSGGNAETALPVSNEDSAPPVSVENTELPACNEDTALPVPEKDTAMLISNVVAAPPVANTYTELPGPSIPVIVGRTIRKKKSLGQSTTPRSWTKRMTKFYCESWGGHNFDHQKIINEMPESHEKWLVRDADFRPQAKNRRFCNRCKQRGHLQWECFEEQKVPMCFMCGASGHSEPWCPNKICLVCGRPSGAFLYGCQNCYMENKNCAACGERGHYVWQCPTAWRSYHATTSVGDGLMPEVLKDYQNQECCKCAKRGHSAFWCTSVHDRQLSRQLPSRSLGNRNRPMGKGSQNPNRFNNMRIGQPPSNSMQKNNKHLKMKQRHKGVLLSRKEQAKLRRARQKLRKAEKILQINV